MRPGDPSLPDLSHVAALLPAAPVVIADVGATGGPEARWRSAADRCHFLALDPRSALTRDPPRTAGDELPRRPVERTGHPLMAEFLNAATTEVVGTWEIALDSLDRVLRTPSRSL